MQSKLSWYISRLYSNIRPRWYLVPKENRNGRKLSKHNPHSPIAPYVYGTYNFFKLRNTESFKCFYNNIYEKTSPTHHPILHQITKLFNSHNPLDLLRLCFVCMKHRKQIYPHPHKGKGSIFALRGFFSPFICTYYNIQFYNTETEHNSQLNKKQKWNLRFVSYKNVYHIKKILQKLGKTKKFPYFCKRMNPNNKRTKHKMEQSIIRFF